MLKEHERTLGGLMRSNQDVLRPKLERARKTGNHHGTKGDMAESELRQMLRQHLPRRYRVTHGFVVDSKGSISLQNDIIIHDAHYCPVFGLDGGEDGACFVPAESVYAVFEAKQELTAVYLQQAAEKAAAVRRLYRTSAPIVNCGEVQSPRTPHRILAGIITLDCPWVDGLGATFDASLRRFGGDAQLNLGFAMTAGAFEWTGEAGAEELVYWEAADALSAFQLRLLARLYSLGTVPGIDWVAYGKAILPAATPVPRKPVLAPLA